MANGDGADDEAERGGDRRAEQDRELGRQAPDLGGMARGVPGHAEEHRVAEGEEADIADQEVEGGGEEGEAERLHQEDRIDDEGRDEARDPEPDHDAVLEADHVARPNSPAGLTSSTIAMMTKITVEEASG
jgi:hypothetical protein